MADEFRLPTNERSEVLPTELDQNFFNSLDQLYARQEQGQLERVQGTLENQGFFKSGQNFKDVSEQVLGPSIERRTQAIYPLARDAAMRGREERMGEEGFQRQRQFADEEFQRRLQEIDKRAQVSRMLMELDADLRGNDGFGFGDFLGQAAGIGAGYFTGGLGAKAGQSLGNKLFGGGKTPSPSTSRYGTAE